MRKDYQKAASGWLYALAAVIAGTCFSATPAQSATCFLPSGECSTGKIGAGPSGGESTPEYCVGYDITEKEYNAKYNNACWDCSDSCVKTSGGTFYKCKTVNNTTWYDKYNVCCTDGTKYDKDDGKCCAGGKCDHPCSGGKQWSPTLKQCVCPSNVETDGNGNCCASGQVLDENKNCKTPCTMNDCSSYPYTSDPGNSEKCNLGCNKGTRYKCKSGYTYSGGSCIIPPAECTDVAATSTRDIISKDYATKEATSQTISTDAVLSCGAENGPSGSLYDYNYTISDSKVSFVGGAPFSYRKHTDGLYYVNLSGYECTQYRCSPLVDGGFYAGLYGSNGNYCCKANAIRDQSSTLRDLRNPSKCKPMPSITPKKHHSLYYVCDSGYTLNGTKCTKAGSYSCPYGYKLNGTTCVSTKTECPEGYEYYGPAGTNKYACVKTVYTCPTNFEYTLSGNKCLCHPETNTCPSDYAASVSCATENGFTLFEHPNYTGCYQCQCHNQGLINGKCTNCSAEGYTQTQTSGYVCTEACPLDSSLFKPSSCTCAATCPDGYSSDKVSVSSCGVQGPGGWNFESKTVCGKTCGKCTAKTCPAGYDTTQKSCPYPTSSVVGGYSGNTACTKCSQSTSSKCPSGAYETQSECNEHVTTLDCFGYKYTGACKKGSISGCWKPFQTAKSKVVISCSGGTCNVGYCLPTNASTSGYWGSACVKVPNSNTTQWKSEQTGFNYSEAGIVSCEITTSKKSGTGCASSSTSASSTCRAEQVIGSSPYDADDGKW